MFQNRSMTIAGAAGSANRYVRARIFFRMIGAGANFFRMIGAGAKNNAENRKGAANED